MVHCLSWRLSLIHIQMCIRDSNWEGKDKDLLALIKHIAEEDKLEKVLENPQVTKTPVVRNGKQSTLGYQPDIWKAWK